jgi:hypothetical protein
MVNATIAGRSRFIASAWLMFAREIMSNDELTN